MIVSISKGKLFGTKVVSWRHPLQTWPRETATLKIAAHKQEAGCKVSKSISPRPFCPRLCQDRRASLWTLSNQWMWLCRLSILVWWMDSQASILQEIMWCNSSWIRVKIYQKMQSWDQKRQWISMILWGLSLISDKSNAATLRSTHPSSNRHARDFKLTKMISKSAN